jgi:hypothetical protein
MGFWGNGQKEKEKKKTPQLHSQGRKRLLPLDLYQLLSRICLSSSMVFQVSCVNQERPPARLPPMSSVANSHSLER